MNFVRTETEVNQLLDLCSERVEAGNTITFNSYEEGVKAAIEWVLGVTNEIPVEETE